MIDGQIVSLGKAVNDLDSVGKALTYLMEKMSLVASYWLEMGRRLGDLCDNVSELRNSPTLRIKVKSLAGKWECVRKEYKEYAIQVGRLKH